MGTGVKVDGMTWKEIEEHFSAIPIELYRGNRIFDVAVTDVPGVGLFYGCPCDEVYVHNSQLLSKKLSEIHDTGTESPKNLSKDDVYGCPDPSLPDEGFFRCQIINNFDEPSVKVCFIDFGNIATVKREDLFYIPQRLQDLPITCKLFSVRGMPILVGSSKRPLKSNYLETYLWFKEKLLNQEVEIVPTTDIKNQPESFLGSLQANGITLFHEGVNVLRDGKKEKLDKEVENQEFERLPESCNQSESLESPSTTSRSNDGSRARRGSEVSNTSTDDETVTVNFMKEVKKRLGLSPEKMSMTELELMHEATTKQERKRFIEAVKKES